MSAVHVPRAIPWEVHLITDCCDLSGIKTPDRGTLQLRQGDFRRLVDEVEIVLVQERKVECDEIFVAKTRQVLQRNSSWAGLLLDRGQLMRASVVGHDRGSVLVFCDERLVLSPGISVLPRGVGVLDARKAPALAVEAPRVGIDFDG